jgi:putative membrane protein
MSTLAEGHAAIGFLGTQGYVWDTRWDMFMTFIGGIIAHFALSGIHDSELRYLKQ